MRIGDLVRINDEMMKIGGWNQTKAISGIVVDITSGDPDSIWVYHTNFKICLFLVLSNGLHVSLMLSNYSYGENCDNT